MIGKQSIQKIIQGCCKKQPKYQRMLVEKYSGFLYAICLRYMHTKEEAQDQLQKAFMRILDKISLYNNEEGNFESWISRVCINLCLSELRKRAPNIIAITEVPQQNLQVNPDIIDQFNENEILDLIQQLPNMYREIFNLNVIDGFNHTEISEMLNIEVSSSRSRLSRAKQMLREKIMNVKKNKSCVNLA